MQSTCKNPHKRVYPVLIVLAVAAQLLPHPANVSPVSAVGLFAGAYARRPAAWLMPLAAVLITDAIAGFYQPLIMLFVYLGFALSTAVGRCLLTSHRSVYRLGLATLLAAVAFYLCSNLGVWIAGLYPPTWTGLRDCYVAGLPYLARSLTGDLLYTGLVFGGYAAVQARHPNDAAASLSLQ